MGFIFNMGMKRIPLLFLASLFLLGVQQSSGRNVFPDSSLTEGCTAPADCPTIGEYCDVGDGSCKEGCDEDRDCEHGSCIMSIHGCRCYSEVFLGPTLTEGCTAPADCPTVGEYCDLEDGLCKEGCDEDRDCEHGSCIMQIHGCRCYSEVFLGPTLTEGCT